MASDSNTITRFADKTPVKSVSIGATLDPTRYFASYNDAALGEWYSRPVEIANYNWIVGGNLASAIDPWAAYFANTSVRRKLSNYTFFCGKLHVKILLNGTSFHYGLLNVSYLPLDLINVQHNPLGATYITGLANYTKASNLQHIYLDPVNNKSGIMCLPFIHPNDTVTISSLVAPTGIQDELGSLYFQTFTPLRAASSTPATTVSVQVVAWLSDVVLSGPTAVSYSGAADDFDPTPSREYTGVLSAPMSLAAYAAGLLSVIPMIGTEASLVSSVLSVGSDVAAYFGFSRALVLDPSTYMKRLPFSSTATTMGADTSIPLSFDPKANVSIDPTLASEANNDNLAVKNFTSMWNFTNKLTWTSAQVHETIIGHAYVYPVDCWTSVVGLASNLNQLHNFTTLGYSCLPFKFWSGTLEYRIRFVSSKYHSGRLKITYNPTQQPTVAQMNSEYNWIIDLSQDTDIVISIPWNQNVAYKTLSADYGTITAPTVGEIGSYDPNAFNGWLTFSVLNELVSPYDLADVDILIDKRGGSDFEVFAPTSMVQPAQTDAAPWWQFFPVIQALSGEADDTYTSLQMFGAAKTDSQVAARKSIYAGEYIPSFRTLMKRYNRATVFYLNEFDSANLHLFQFIHQRVLPYPGIAPLGRSDTASGLDVNYGQLTLIQFLGMGFLGQRGSLRYKYNVSTQSVRLGAMRAMRDYRGQFFGDRTNWSNYQDTTADDEGLYAYQAFNFPTDQGWTGTFITAGAQQDALEMNYPYYSNQRFLTNDYISRGLVNNIFPSASDDELVMIEFTGADDGVGSDRIAAVEVWQSTGEDFSFVHWLGPPTVFSPEFLSTPAVA